MSIGFDAQIAVAAASLTLASFTPVAHAQTAGDEAGNKAIAQRAFDAWAAGTGSPYDLLAENANWTITGNSLASKTYPSREAFLSEVIRPFNVRMGSGLKPSIRNIYADDSTVVVFFDASGTARDGQPHSNTYAWFLNMTDGKITDAAAFFDSIAFNDLWNRVPPNQ
ncbi:nuclear transport factor 2 family protein [Pararhizobium sp. A13]|uniref:nuclear transport factor 2 family protein n=1 Tax=Pararhizobium sp. A13 TaxID=3133975 RepID=UPI00311AFDB4